jgi:hypothetical protein
MGETPSNSSLFTSLRWAAQYHYDAMASLQQYLTPSPPHFPSRFDPMGGARLQAEPADYFRETGLRSSLALLTRIEAAFHLDFQYRCRERLKDDLSRAFRAIANRKPNYVSLEKDIFAAWSRYTSETHRLLGELRGAFKFRNWLAHGSYWTPKLGRNFDFESLYLLADAVFSAFPLRGIDKE